MSAALVRKSLALIDDTFKSSPGNINNVFELIPENQKLMRRIKPQGKKSKKVNAIKVQKKLTVVEVQNSRKSKDERIKDNLKKLKLIKQLCKIDLDEKIESQIIERAVTRRPVHKKVQNKEAQQTAFTEEDFKKFEEEYFDDE